MENTKIETQAIPSTTEQVFTHDALLKALYYVWDAFDRVNMPYFLAGQTAESVIAQKELRGSKISIGVRDMEWKSGARRILDAFITPVSESPTLVTYEFEGVPIHLTVYPTSPCIEQTDMVRYKHEEFKVPNPYQTFLKTYYV